MEAVRFSLEHLERAMLRLVQAWRLIYSGGPESINGRIIHHSEPPNDRGNLA